MRYIDDEYTEEFYKEIRRITESGKVWQGTVKIRRKNGEIRYGERIITPILDDKGKITHYVAATRNITNQLVQHQKLIEMDKMYRIILDNIQDVFFITDKDGTIVDFNSQAEKLFDFTREELLQFNVSELYANIEDRKLFQETIQREGKVENYLIRMKNKNGSIFPISLNAFLRKDDNGRIIGYIGILHDVSLQENL
jgi:PAS domain S-box-containing protein